MEAYWKRRIIDTKESRKLDHLTRWEKHVNSGFLYVDLLGAVFSGKQRNMHAHHALTLTPNPNPAINVL